MKVKVIAKGMTGYVIYVSSSEVYNHPEVNEC